MTTGYTPPVGPVTGAFQLTVDGNPYGVPQPVGSTFVISGLPVGSNNGLHTLGAQYLGDLDYDAQHTSTVIIKVVPAKLTLTALDQTRLYGDLNPALTYSITGFVTGDFLDQSKLSGAPVLTTTAVDHTSPAGIYPITVTLGTLELHRHQLHDRYDTAPRGQADRSASASDHSRRQPAAPLRPAKSQCWYPLIAAS